MNWRWWVSARGTLWVPSAAVNFIPERRQRRCLANIDRGGKCRQGVSRHHVGNDPTASAAASDAAADKPTHAALRHGDRLRHHHHRDAVS